MRIGLGIVLVTVGVVFLSMTGMNMLFRSKSDHDTPAMTVDDRPTVAPEATATPDMDVEVNLPPIDLATPQNTETATFALG
jgi:hypothetical protein